MEDRKCIVPDCDKGRVVRRLCRPHYFMWWSGQLDTKALGIEIPEPMSHAEAGAIGGRSDTTGGFASKRRGKDGLTGRERARLAGTKGGKISRRKYD